MRINELLAEETLDELNLAKNIGRGIGKVATGVGKAVGGVQGAWRGAKDAYNQGKAQTYAPSRNTVSGGAPQTAPNQTQPTTPPAAGKDQGLGQHSDGEYIQTGDKFDHETGQPLPVQNNQQQQTTPPTDNQQQQLQKSSAMNATAIAGELKGVWDKARADQGSAIGDGRVKQQITAMAKDAGMTGMKIESVGYSRFLGMDL
jgi:hypothetical protein